MQIKKTADSGMEPLELTDAQARADMYRFLSAVYLDPPRPELLKCMTDGKALDELCRFFLKAGGSDSALLNLVESTYRDQDSAALEQEYMDLFAVPAGRYVFPFEDVYRAKSGDGSEAKGPLLGCFAIDVSRLYREAWGQIEPGCKELPTHVGVELSFMSFVCQQEAEALQDPSAREEEVERIRRLQLAFLKDHLNEWFPLLARAIQVNAAAGFYPTVAWVTEEFLRWDTANLQRSLEREFALSS